MGHDHERLAPGIVWCALERTLAIYPDQTGQPNVEHLCQTEEGRQEMISAVWQYYVLTRPDVRNHCVRICVMVPRSDSHERNVYRMGSSAYPLRNALEAN